LTQTSVVATPSQSLLNFHQLASHVSIFQLLFSIFTEPSFYCLSDQVPHITDYHIPKCLSRPSLRLEETLD